MKRLLFGIFLDVASTIVLVFFMVLPAVMPIEDVPVLKPVLQSLLCERGETIEVERFSHSRRLGQMSYSANYYCARESGARRDVSGKILLYALIGFIVPMLIGVVFIISGSMSLKKNRQGYIYTDTNVVSLLEGFGISAQDQAQLFGTRTPDSTDSLSERLQTLKNAYDQGLITQEEYDTKRKEILRDV